MSRYKQIFKNAIFLYIRMFVIMAVSLYTSRCVLKILGVEDYGIYNVVGGFVLLLSFLNTAMATATQRYISFDIGKEDLQNLKKTFSTSLLIHILIALLIIFLAETIGLWYINKVMVYNQERTIAVNVIYQFLLLSFVLNIIQVPYNALIMAHEKMSVYAYLSFFEAILKLLIVLILPFFTYDKLIMYSVLTFIVALIVRISYQFYCRKNFEESKLQYIFDKVFFKELLSYSSWNLLGNMASVLRIQGNNVLINFFFGVSINAAYGLTLQVNSSITSLVSNFQNAFNPQIIKTYAIGDKMKSFELTTYSSKLSFFIMLIVLAPVYFNLDFLLKTWLVNVPKYTVDFLKISLIMLLVDSLSGPLMTLITATGKIKKYHIVIGSFMLLCLPITYLFLRNGYSPTITFIIMLSMSIISLLLRINFVRTLLNVDILFFLKINIIRVAIISIFVFLTIIYLKPYLEINSLIDFIKSSLLIVSLTLFFILLLGITAKERKFIYNILIKK